MKKTLQYCKPELVDTFILYFKSAILKNPDLNTILKYNDFRWYHELKKIPYFKIENSNIESFDEEKLIEQWPVDTSHGKRLLPAHQVKKLAELFAQQFEKSSEKNTEVNSAEQQSTPLWFLKKFIDFFGKQPEKKPVIITKTTDEADQIWLAIIKGNDDKPEGDYNDHDQLYYFISLVTRNYIKKELEKSLTPEQKEKLKTDLKKDIKSITDKSSLRYVKRSLGFSEYKQDSKSFNAAKINTFAGITTNGATYETPCFNDADRFATALETRRPIATC